MKDEELIERVEYGLAVVRSDAQDWAGIDARADIALKVYADCEEVLRRFRSLTSVVPFQLSARIHKTLDLETDEITEEAR